MGIHTSSMYQKPEDPWAGSIEAIMGIALTRCLLAKDEASRIRASKGIDGYLLGLADGRAEAWEDAARLLADVLRERRGGRR